MVSTAVVTIVVAILGLLGGAGGVVAYLRWRDVEKPTARADIVHKGAETNLINAQTHQAQIETVQGLLKDVSAEREAAYARIDKLTDRVDRVEAERAQQADQLIEVRDQVAEFQRILAIARKALTDHIPWDVAVLEVAREQDPNYPPAPPLSF